MRFHRRDLTTKVTLLMVLAVDSVYFVYSVDSFFHTHIHICAVTPLIVYRTRGEGSGRE